mmetsp:Transcript_45804/g.60677  ORF Transcript_45804/g.60677 Transcript_45804/m.60677 type:complete len:98 (+) Transcript_45804:594-887(+)|eukprot:CAMPEP_0185582258 /NCGR_PEP_ID=MMETSP0434-20130131/20250_1 /TAXON_ID=626734 ORGANISM="Favella taraikaensis, Strain Fe Narragansett Bay" /NCGR_SAMPLE_ID=MMETSP0434 /ASSEMBLY_ACC=CAM_ASM_000379 /LENGTH=97 /DNA_ID=CAMNT_0028201025 /DNA_START=543 /DNA_END=836 /DNA_ORIENTATION=-
MRPVLVALAVPAVSNLLAKVDDNIRALAENDITPESHAVATSGTLGRQKFILVVVSAWNLQLVRPGADVVDLTFIVTPGETVKVVDLLILEGLCHVV